MEYEVVDAIISLNQDLCWNIFNACNSSEWIGGYVEVPLNLTEQERVEQMLYPFSKQPLFQDLITNMALVRDYHKSVSHSLWDDGYSLFILLEEDSLNKIVKWLYKKQFSYRTHLTSFTILKYSNRKRRIQKSCRTLAA